MGAGVESGRASGSSRPVAVGRRPPGRGRARPRDVFVDEPNRKGFAYGTLPGHPESGEEAFIVELHDNGAVTFTITAFSRPATLLARVRGPISRAIQSWITNRYLRAV